MPETVREQRTLLHPIKQKEVQPSDTQYYSKCLSSAILLIIQII